jgi:hypothetical protein
VRIHKPSTLLLLAALSLIGMMSPAVSAQVVIDMPAPKARPRQAAPIPAPGPIPTLPPERITVEPGDVALARYSRARTYPYGTYLHADRYAGIRQYGYPYQVWWGWGFSGFHHCGNRFTGFVGRPSFCGTSFKH